MIFSINGSPRSGRSSVKSEDLQINILCTFTAELKQSPPAAATDAVVVKSTIRVIKIKIMKILFLQGSPS